MTSKLKIRNKSNEKPRMDLLPFESLEAVARVLTKGIKDHGEEDWKKVDNAQAHFTGALLRHLTAYRKGRKFDAKSRESHLAHVAANALFLVWFEESGKADGKK